jgi:hypothetical protein
MPNTPPTSNVGSHKGSGGGEMLIETTQYGNILRVAAIEAATGLEVTFQAPLSASRAMIERIAHDKLMYVKKRQK